MGPVAWFGRFKTTPAWAWLIAAISLVGIIYGFYYYVAQFRVTPLHLWIFVPDSPLAVLWAELALGLWWFRRRAGTHTRPSRWQSSLDALAIVGNIQVGLWTVYVLLAYADHFGTYKLNLNTILLAGHAGMAVLALIFLAGARETFRASRPTFWFGVGVAAAYYLVNDVLDYLVPGQVFAKCGMRPYTVPCVDSMEPTLTVVTFGLTFCGLAALLLSGRQRNPRVR